MSDRPSVGLAIPARNAARYIGETLASVLTQTYGLADVVVVDDGSTDATVEIASALGAPVRVVQQPPTGPAAARNHGIRALGTDLVALLDADDVWPAHSVDARVAALNANPDAAMCFGRMIQFASPELSPEQRQRLFVDPRPLTAWTSSGMLARREVFERVGFLDEQRRAGDFMDWLLRARAAGARAITIEDVVVRRRLHLDNLTRREPHENANYLAIVRAELARRRAQGESQ